MNTKEAWALVLQPAQVTNVNFLHSSSGSSTHSQDPLKIRQLHGQRQLASQ